MILPPLSVTVRLSAECITIDHNVVFFIYFFMVIDWNRIVIVSYGQAMALLFIYNRFNLYRLHPKCIMFVNISKCIIEFMFYNYVQFFICYIS